MIVCVVVGLIFITQIRVPRNPDAGQEQPQEHAVTQGWEGEGA